MGSDRVGLVTGAARGIGAAVVDRLAADGYRVVAVDACEGDRVTPGVSPSGATRADLEHLQARWGDRVITLVADVRDLDALTRAAGMAVDRFGRLDVAVAAAGILVGGAPLWETPVHHLSTALDVNAIGVWHTATATVPLMLAGPAPQGCRFVAVASAAGERGLFRLAAYTASKHAVVGMVRGLAADLAGTGVTAVAVSPGSTDTAMLAATASVYDTTTADLASHQGLRRPLSADEVAAVVAFCCSPDAASLNGSVVNADGGFGL